MSVYDDVSGMLGPFPSASATFSYCNLFTPSIIISLPLFCPFFQSFSHWEVMPCGCCASRSVSEPFLRSDRVASLVTSALILPHVKTNPVLTLADQYSSSRAGENVTRGRRLKAHSQSGSRWRLLHKHRWGEKNADSISDKPRCSGVLITASSDA